MYSDNTVENILMPTKDLQILMHSSKNIGNIYHKFYPITIFFLLFVTCITFHYIIIEEGKNIEKVH